MPPQLPDLERAATLLADLPALWLHQGVTHEQREALVREIFQRITIDGKEFVSIEPKPPFIPLFATIATDQKLGYRETDSPPSPRPGASVLAIWLRAWSITEFHSGDP